MIRIINIRYYSDVSSFYLVSYEILLTFFCNARRSVCRCHDEDLTNFLQHHILNKMSESTDKQVEQCDIILPKQGALYQKVTLNYILCKPKLIPLKSVTLEKLEKMQKDAEIKLREAQEIESNSDINA